MRHGLISSLALASLFLSFGNDSVHAGAWLKPEGQTEIIFSTMINGAKRKFDSSGKTISVGSFSKSATQAIAEYGLTNDITLIAELTGQSQKFSNLGINSGSMNWSGVSGARFKIWSDNQSVISFQTTAEFVGEKQNKLSKTIRFEPPTSLDMRFLFGHNFTLKEMPAFLDLQAGYRWRGGSHPDEIRIDLTLGLRPLSKTLLLFQSFNSFSLERRNQFQMKRTRQHKIQASLVYEITPSVSLQAGAFISILGQESLRERGGLLALWWKL